MKKESLSFIWKGGIPKFVSQFLSWDIRQYKKYMPPLRSTVTSNSRCRRTRRPWTRSWWKDWVLRKKCSGWPIMYHWWKRPSWKARRWTCPMSLTKSAGWKSVPREAWVPKPTSLWTAFPVGMWKFSSTVYRWTVWVPLSGWTIFR